MQLRPLKSTALIFLFILSCLAISSCGKSPIENAIEDLVDAGNANGDENNTDGNNDGGNGGDGPSPTFTANINDTEFVASTLLAQSLTGATVSIGDSGYVLGITGQYLSSDLKRTQVIILYIFGADFDELSANTEFDVTSNILGSEVPGAFAIYGGDPNVDVDDDNFGTENLEEILIKITAIDKEKKLVSGEFNFIAIDEDSDLEYKVTEGVFTHLEYKIQ